MRSTMVEMMHEKSDRRLKRRAYCFAHYPPKFAQCDEGVSGGRRIHHITEKATGARHMNFEPNVAQRDSRL